MRPPVSAARSLEQSVAVGRGGHRSWFHARYAADELLQSLAESGTGRRGDPGRPAETCAAQSAEHLGLLVGIGAGTHECTDRHTSVRAPHAHPSALVMQLTRIG